VSTFRKKSAVWWRTTVVLCRTTRSPRRGPIPDYCGPLRDPLPDYRGPLRSHLSDYTGSSTGLHEVICRTTVLIYQTTVVLRWSSLQWSSTSVSSTGSSSLGTIIC